MEVRSSGSGNYNNHLTDKSNAAPAPAPAPAPAKYENRAEKVETGQVRSNTELKKLERQGVSVSSGEEQVVKALERALKALEGPTTTFEVSMHKPTNSIMVKVLNKETGELIREIPPEKTLDLVASMMEIAGIMVDERI